MRFAALLATCLAVSTSVAYAEGDDPLGLTNVPTTRYLVTTTHTAEQCLSALDEMAAKSKKTLSKMQWGCKDGDHTGYMFVDAADKESALKVLPDSSRANAKVVEVTKFSPKKLKAIHAKMDKDAASKAAAK